MATYGDTHVSDDVAHALTAGLSESTIESQHIRAIAVLTAATPQSASHAAAITAAIALLNISLTHLRDPIHH